MCVSVFVLILYPLVPSTKDLALIWKTRQLFDAFCFQHSARTFPENVSDVGECERCGLCGLYVLWLVNCALWIFRICTSVHWTTTVDVVRLQFGIQFGAGLSHMSGSLPVIVLAGRRRHTFFSLFTVARLESRVSILFSGPLCDSQLASFLCTFVKCVYFWDL